MTKKRTSAKPKAKQGKKATQPAVAEEVAVDESVTEDAAAMASTPVSATTSADSTATRRRTNRVIRQQVKTLALEEEYAYVVKDLRRVFILGGLMFAGLIAVNLAFTFLGG